jgi:hypothetical protein
MNPVQPHPVVVVVVVVVVGYYFVKTRAYCFVR